MNAIKMAKLFVLSIALVLMSTAVFAATNVTFNNDALEVEFVRINGEVYQDGESLRTDLGDDLDIRVKLRAFTDVEDVEVSARLVGYQHADREKLRVYDVISIGKLDTNDVQFFDLNLDVPVLTDKDYYYIRVEVLGRDVNYDFVSNIRLNIVGDDNLVVIRRVSFDPQEVVAGRALRARVRLENLGERDEDDVFVKVAIPELGSHMFVTADIDELKQNELTTSEDLLLRISECTPAGVYDVVTTVTFNDGYDTTTEVSQLRILAGEPCGAQTPAETTSRTVITPPVAQEIVAEEGASFPVAIKNEGDTDRAYIVTVTGVAGWASADVSNPAPIVKAGETAVVYVYVTPNQDVTGQKVFTISISDGRDSRDLQVSTNVLPAESSWNWGLWVLTAIIVLLIIVVIMALIVGLRKDNNDEEDYY